MLNRQTFVRVALSAGVLAVLTACAMKPPANVAVLTAQLSGANEVPPTGKPGTGEAEVQYNKDTGVVQWKVTYRNMSGPVTGAHMHGPAGPTANAGVLVPFSNVATSPIAGEAKITPAQAGDLLAGLWYVNVHTAAHPPGEIRGQLRLRP